MPSTNGAEHTIQCNARNCAADANELPLQEIIDKYPGQISLLGIQFQWTFDCEDALRRAKHEKTAMSQTSKKINTLFQEMLSITTQANLLKRERTQIETMITIDVHQKDVFDDLMKQKVKQVDDFEWQKQARFYWSVQEDDCYIDIADARSRYCNEYLGIKERLVITALTDRCYITLTQALSMYFGGAPAGPAGTGKSVLALAAGLESVVEKRQHRRVVVFRPLFAVGGQDLGYLPGSEQEKMSPWSAAVVDALEAVAERQMVEELMEEGILETLPLTHIRGRTLTDTWVVIDEAQNLERSVLLTALSRIGPNSRVVITHDVAQRDNLRVGRHDGVLTVVNDLQGHPLFAHMSLTRSERSPVAGLVAGLLETEPLSLG